MNRLRLPRFRMIHVPVFYILVLHAATGWCQNSGSPSTTGEGVGGGRLRSDHRSNFKTSLPSDRPTRSSRRAGELLTTSAPA